jgi:hypothetical protein
MGRLLRVHRIGGKRHQPANDVQHRAKHTAEQEPADKCGEECAHFGVRPLRRSST